MRMSDRTNTFRRKKVKLKEGEKINRLTDAEIMLKV